MKDQWMRDRFLNYEKGHAKAHDHVERKIADVQKRVNRMECTVFPQSIVTKKPKSSTKDELVRKIMDAVSSYAGTMASIYYSSDMYCDYRRTEIAYDYVKELVEQLANLEPGLVPVSPMRSEDV